MPERLQSWWYDSTRQRTVGVEARAEQGRFVVHVVERVRGARDARVTAESGPLELVAATARVAELAQGLRAEGLDPSGLDLALAALTSSSARARGGAARRLARLGDPRAVQPLILALARRDPATGEIARALGELGDGRAVVALRELSGDERPDVRRAGVEALRALGDDTGLHEVRQRALARLEPSGLAAFLRSVPGEGAGADDLERVAAALEERGGGELLDDLYELGTETARAAVLRWLDASRPHPRAGLGAASFTASGPPGANAAGAPTRDFVRISRAGVWRAVKSVLKRSEARRDWEVLARVLYLVERSSRGSAVRVGRRWTPVFSDDTRGYLLRWSARLLERVARDEPLELTALGVALLLQYEAQDLEPQHLPTARLFASVTRPTSGVSEPAAVPDPGDWAPPGAHLWDADPRPLLDLLLGSPCALVHEFAVAWLRREAFHGRVPLGALTSAELVRLLEAPHPATIELASAELDRRFDPAAPDLALIEALVASEREPVRARAHEWLRASLPAWRHELDALVLLLRAPYADTRELGAELASDVLQGADAGARARLLDQLLLALARPEPAPGFDGPAVRVVRAHLSDLLLQGVSSEWAWSTLRSGTPGLRELMAEVVRARPPEPEQLGPHELLELASDELLVVRETACALIERDLARHLARPATLRALADSAWEDVRAYAAERLRRVVGEALDLDALVDLCDSERPDVQALGRELVLAHLGRLPLEELVLRLAEHPDDGPRAFAVELLVAHAPAGTVSLLKLRGFLRRVLFAVARERASKRRLLAHLRARARASELEARVAAAALGEFVFARGEWDRADALELLATIATWHPQVPVPLRVEGPPCA